MSQPTKFKNDIRVEGDIQLPAETAERALIIDATGELTSSVTTSAELAHLSGVTSSVQTQLTAAQDAADAAQAAIDAHLIDTTDAHDASAISSVPTGNLAATDVQSALNELQGDIDALDTRLDAIEPDVADLITLSGVAANSTTLGTFTGAIIPDNSTIKAAIQALETEIEAIPSPFYYAGTWSAATNTPTLSNLDTGVQGAVYYVTAAGSVDFGAGAISFEIGDKVANNGTTWDKWDMTDAVATVFGRTGAVVAQSGDYTASQVTNVPAGTIAATDVQAAINELDGDIQGHINNGTDAHDASAISVIPVGNLSSATVQGALVELQDEIDDLVVLSGVVSGSTNLGTFTGTIIPDASDIKEALQALETEIETLPIASTGDIPETSFSIANNQAAPANVTGLAFAAGVVRSFNALVSVEIDATADLYEQFTLNGINKGGTFDMSVFAVGDNSGVTFSITTAGQVQYTSGNVPGFVSGAIKFRAIVTSV